MTAQSLIPGFTTASAQRQGIMLAMLHVAVACMVVAVHSVLVAMMGAVGLVWIILITLGATYLSFELAFAIMMVFLFLQNAFAAAVIPLISDQNNFQILLGSGALNMLLTACICAALWFRWQQHVSADNKRLLISIGIFLLAIALYTALGAEASSVSDALVYARIYVIGIFMLTIGVAMGLRLSFDYLMNVISVMSVILVAWGVVEFCFTYDMYSIFNIKDYVNLKYVDINYLDSYSSTAEVVQSYMRPYLNLSGQFGIEFSVLRPRGPNIHPITYGYALTFCCLLSFVKRRYLVAGACFLIGALVGAKGPLLMIVASILLCLQYEKTRNARWLAIALLAIVIIYSAGGIAYGKITEDFHILGLLGALKGFAANPLGNGIGVGGSLSTLGTGANFEEFQDLGSADFALESAIGVLLYQFGIAAVSFFVFYWYLWKNVWKAALFFSDEPRFMIVPIVLALLVVNAIFQEEAFSPLGWGPWLMVSGVLLITYWRQTARAPGLTEFSSTAMDGRTMGIS